MENDSARAEDPTQFSNQASIFSLAKGTQKSKKTDVIETEFQSGLEIRKQYDCRHEAEAISGK